MAILFYKRDRSDYGWMSNFSHTPFCMGGVVYQTNEHWFQSQKPKRQDQRQEIATAPSAREAKKLGRACDIRGDWEDVKERIMVIGLHAKFTQNPRLYLKLLETGEEKLVEDSPKDAYWGAPDGKGKNRLGVLLMELRAHFRCHELLTGILVWDGMVLCTPTLAGRSA